jgi:hypothetical protein
MVGSKSRNHHFKHNRSVVEINYVTTILPMHTIRLAADIGRGSGNPAMSDPKYNRNRVMERHHSKS